MSGISGLDYREMGQLPLPAQWLIALLLVIALQVVGYWLYLKPKFERLEQLKQQEIQHKAMIALKTQKAMLLPLLQEQLDELSLQYNSIARQLPAQKELASLLAAVNDVGLFNSLTFARIDWGQKQAQGFLYALPLNIELTGEYHHIGSFAEAIASLPRIINFEQLHWHRVSLESPILHFSARAHTYQFNPEVKREN